MGGYNIFSPRTSKYGNRKTIYNGVSYDSAKEADYARKLFYDQKAGEIREVQIKPRFTLHGANNVKICVHIPDFLITLNNGTQEVHEVKSYASKTPVWKLKKKLFEAEYPQYRYLVVD